MITATDFKKQADRRIDNTELSKIVISSLERQLESRMEKLKMYESERINLAERIKSNSIQTLLFAMVYLGNDYVFKQCKKEFEPRGFTVGYDIASGISLRITI
jgi:hypothetical protein